MAPSVDNSTLPLRTDSNDAGPFSALRASRNGELSKLHHGRKPHHPNPGPTTTQHKAPTDVIGNGDKSSYKLELPKLPTPFPWPQKEIPIPDNLPDVIAWTEAFVVRAGDLAIGQQDIVKQILIRLQSLLTVYFGRAVSSSDTWQNCVEALEANIKLQKEAAEGTRVRLSNLLHIYFGRAPSSHDTLDTCIEGLENHIKAHLDNEEDVSHALKTFRELRQWGYPHREEDVVPIPPVENGEH